MDGQTDDQQTDSQQFSSCMNKTRAVRNNQKWDMGGERAGKRKGIQKRSKWIREESPGGAGRYEEEWESGGIGLKILGHEVKFQIGAAVPQDEKQTEVLQGQDLEIGLHHRRSIQRSESLQPAARQPSCRANRQLYGDDG